MTYYPSTLIDRSFRERIVLVGVIFPETTAESLDRELDELALLAESAGDTPVARVVAKRKAPDAALFIGTLAALG